MGAPQAPDDKGKAINEKMKIDMVVLTCRATAESLESPKRGLEKQLKQKVPSRECNRHGVANKRGVHESTKKWMCLIERRRTRPQWLITFYIISIQGF